jgi:hypothetical protein
MKLPPNPSLLRSLSLGGAEDLGMDVTQLPFNRYVGPEPGADDCGFLIRLPNRPQYTNHLGILEALPRVRSLQVHAPSAVLTQRPAMRRSLRECFRPSRTGRASSESRTAA